MSEEGRFVTMHSKIHRRSGHVAVAYKGRVIVWGGYMEQVQQTPVSPIVSEYHCTDEIWVYNCFTEIWDRIVTKGDIPPRNSGSCGVVLRNHLYIFGGYHGESDPGSMEGNSNQLYRLDLSTATWEWLHPLGTQPAPCDKLVGWLYDKKLYFFGGFGPPPTMHPVPFQHTLDVATQSAGWPRGWNNQLVCYSPADNCWEWPRARGPVPTPRAAHAADKVGDKVYVFGGRFLNQRSNDLHCLDMTSLRWSGNLTKPYEPGPQGRSWHSFTFISPTRAVLYGGLNQFNTVLNDCWQVDLPACNWVACQHLENKPRLWHKAQFLETTGDLVIIGGHCNNILDPVGRKDHAEELLVLNFAPKTLLRLCLDAVLNYADQLETEWNVLPQTLAHVLRMRRDQWNLE